MEVGVSIRIGIVFWGLLRLLWLFLQLRLHLPNAHHMLKASTRPICVAQIHSMLLYCQVWIHSHLLKQKASVTWSAWKWSLMLWMKMVQSLWEGWCLSSNPRQGGCKCSAGPGDSLNSGIKQGRVAWQCVSIDHWCSVQPDPCILVPTNWCITSHSSRYKMYIEKTGIIYMHQITDMHAPSCSWDTLLCKECIRISYSFLFIKNKYILLVQACLDMLSVQKYAGVCTCVLTHHSILIHCL